MPSEGLVVHDQRPDGVSGGPRQGGETETVIHRNYCVPRTLMTMTRGCIGNRRTYLIDLTLDPTEAWIN